MSAVLMTTASDASLPEAERHTLLQSLALHLLPGVATLAAMLVLAPIMQSAGLPVAMALFLGAFAGVVPVQMGILYYLGWKRNGRLSLAGVVRYRQRTPVVQMLLLVLALFLWSGVVFSFLRPWLDGLLLPAFGWLPPLFQPMTDDFSTLPRSIALTTWAVGFGGTALAAPFVEELYFRGFLLPRMPLSQTWAPLVHALLFSLYHFWTPWQNLTRIAMLIPIAYAVQKKASIWISFDTHFLCNAFSMMGLLTAILQ